MNLSSTILQLNTPFGLVDAKVSYRWTYGMAHDNTSVPTPEIHAIEPLFDNDDESYIIEVTKHIADNFTLYCQDAEEQICNKAHEDY